MKIALRAWYLLQLPNDAPNESRCRKSTGRRNTVSFNTPKRRRTPSPPLRLCGLSLKPGLGRGSLKRLHETKIRCLLEALPLLFFQRLLFTYAVALGGSPRLLSIQATTFAQSLASAASSVGRAKRGIRSGVQQCGDVGLLQHLTRLVKTRSTATKSCTLSRDGNERIRNTTLRLNIWTATPIHAHLLNFSLWTSTPSGVILHKLQRNLSPRSVLCSETSHDVVEPS